MAPGSTAGSDIGIGRRSDRDDSKVQKPDLYYGDREKLEDWFHQVQMYFLFTSVGTEKRTLFATTFMRGRAQHWIKPYLHKFLEDGPEAGDTNGLFADFNTLKENMRLVFGVTNDKETAIRVIQHLRQKSSASEYAIKFQEYAQVTDWDNNALMTMFRRGLKENVKDELMRNGGIITTLDVLIRTAIDIDDKLYERAMEKKHSFNPRGTYGFNGGIKGNQNAGDPMDLSATDKRRKPGQRKQKNNNAGKKSITCYGCGKEGHMKRDCRSAGKVQRTQFNTVDRSPREFNVVQNVRKEDGRFSKERPPRKIAEHDTRTLTMGAVCLDDNCEAHEDEKAHSQFHYMLSPIGCKIRHCGAAHFGSTGIPVELKELNMMIRPSTKATNTPAWETRPVSNIDKAAENKAFRQSYMSPNRPNHPRHHEVHWRDCYQIGCITHETARQAEEEKMPPINTEAHPDHGILDWTECTSTDCAIHWDEKRQARSQTSQGENRTDSSTLSEETKERVQEFIGDQLRISAIEPDLGQRDYAQQPLSKLEQDNALEEGEIQDESNEAESVNENTPEGSEYDSTDDELDSENNANHIQFAAEANKPVIKMIQIITRNHKEAFQVHKGKMYLHPHHFDNMLRRIRTEFWNHRLYPTEYNAKAFVQEWPPLGSDFTNGGYLVPDGTFISQTMRNNILRVKKLYHEMHVAQVIATDTMTDQEFIDDDTRAQKVIQGVQQHMAQQSLPMPMVWETQFKHALKQHGFPPNHSKDKEKTLSKSEN